MLEYLLTLLALARQATPNIVLPLNMTSFQSQIDSALLTEGGSSLPWPSGLSSYTTCRMAITIARTARLSVYNTVSLLILELRK